MNKLILAFLSATLLAWAGTAVAGDSWGDGRVYDRGGDAYEQERGHGHDGGHDSRDRQGGHGHYGDIRVMTQNQYLGGDISPLIAAASADPFSPADFSAAVVTALQQVAASHTPERIKALAGEILDERPDLVGLQEVWKFECLPAAAPAPGTGCDDPSIRGAFNDHLELTRAALGRAYGDVAQVTNLSIEFFDPYPGVVGPYPGIPFEINGVPALLRVTDRDVIFVRRDVAASALPVDFDCVRVSDDGCNYEAAVPLPLIGRIERGFVGVDVTVNRKKYRFVNTHLETRDQVPAFVQSFQMQELLGHVLQTSPARRLILAGDFNSDPGEVPDAATIAYGATTPYFHALETGLYDAWLLQPRDPAGLSCCQAADLRNWRSQLSQRIDLLFVREMPARVKDAEVLGASRRDRIRLDGTGLWPSDHGAVAVTLDYR